LKDLAAFPVQKIYLTATLPPELERELKVASCLPESVPVIRESTDRPNLAYHVLHYDGYNVRTAETVVGLAQLLEKQFETDSRGIIFCRTVARVEQLAPRFLHCKDHSKMTQEDRMNQFERWRSGMAKWVVATTGLLHGIDYGWVDAIIFIEMPYGLVNFAQGAGRAGRKGRPSTIFLLHSSEQGQIMPHASDSDETCLVGGQEYMLNTTICRRFVLTKIMDGMGVRCDEVFNALHCDICEPHSKLVLESNALVAVGGRARQPRVYTDAILNASSIYRDGSVLTLGEQVQDVMGGRMSLSEGSQGVGTSSLGNDSIQQWTSPPSRALDQGRGPSMSILMDTGYAQKQKETLEEKVKLISRVTEVVKGHCAVCWAWKKRRIPADPDHKPFSSCKDKGEYVKGLYGWLDFKHAIKPALGKYEYCYNCGLPQGKLLPSSHPSFEQGMAVKKCPLNDFAAVVLWHIFHHDETWIAACKDNEELVEIMDVPKFRQWVVVKKGQDMFWNGLELILWFMRKREEKKL
jgi:hypothetical protein